MDKWESPFIDRLAGLPKEQAHLESKLQEFITENIARTGSAKLEDIELEKTPKEIELIQFATDSVDSMLKKYGRKKVISVPLSHIHVMPEHGTQEYTDDKFEEGAYSSKNKSILLDRTKSEIDFCLTVFHELLHLKSYSALQLIRQEGQKEVVLKTYRSGISVMSRDGKILYLNNIEEGIVGHLTKQFYESVVKSNSQFADEIKAIELSGQSVNTSRNDEVAKLYSLIGEIFEQNKNEYSDKEEILNLFIDAQVNGNLMPVGRLVEKTFGEGTLKRLDADAVE